MNTGSIKAGDTKNPKGSIKRGFITGDGLLGEVLAATNELVAAACEVVHSGIEVPVLVRLRHENAWLTWYAALKAIEKVAE